MMVDKEPEDLKGIEFVDGLDDLDHYSVAQIELNDGGLAMLWKYKRAPIIYPSWVISGAPA